MPVNKDIHICINDCFSNLALLQFGSMMYNLDAPENEDLKQTIKLLLLLLIRKDEIVKDTTSRSLSNG